MKRKVLIPLLLLITILIGSGFSATPIPDSTSQTSATTQTPGHSYVQKLYLNNPITINGKTSKVWLFKSETDFITTMASLPQNERNAIVSNNNNVLKVQLSNNKIINNNYQASITENLNNPYKNYLNEYLSGKSTNPQIIQAFQQNNVQTISTQAKETVTNNYLTSITQLNAKQKEYNNANCDTNPSGKCNTIKTDLATLKQTVNTNQQIFSAYNIPQYEALSFMTTSEASTMIQEINKNQCSNSMFPSFCEYFSNQNIAQTAASSFTQTIQSNQEIQNYKNSDPTKYNSLVNQQASAIFNNNKYFSKPSECSGTNKVTQACINAIQNIQCNSNTNCEQQKQIAISVYQQAWKETAIQSTGTSSASIWNNIILGIFNPDQNAIKAAALFGFKANYSNVPAWLNDSTPSLICEAKIQGYLNTQKQTSYGTTQYGCENSGVLGSNSTSCLPTIIGDLRAQRTQITPDNNTAITYSYYLKAPKDSALYYTIGISYTTGSNQVSKLIFGSPKELGPGASYSNQDFINFNLSNVSSINPDSFHIGLLAIYKGSKQVYFHIVSPIVLINYGTYYEGLYQSTSSSVTTPTTSQSTQDNPLSSNNMLNKMFS